MWRSMATSFVGYRAPGSTDRLLGYGRTPIKPHQTGVPRQVSCVVRRRRASGMAGGEPEVVEQFHGILACGNHERNSMKHEAITASPNSGVNTLSGEGLAEVIASCFILFLS